ncbi:hypothetical protein C3747_169g59 [Trypanosoma cruzi]|uniref:Uncharacterized protein n=2 Tax=Trypanosoma cruzi TaxID=5693 RepID=Q4D9P6_TRYCC|nr:hypothetical protein, conserved [Trypanosoma cruzi]EAN89239.1 hypothetical protein, conserved [Trypanosoma cruzi]KAF5221398.1 hypothetical protein ECC02_005640 [Trypanosoma cruzi]PWV03809.1 hypothetical protein C3747_169g59 [Trypanosoma cruzi]RNC58275.1 hypothetical protein TcCL_ESM04082 [Trypanosoma cruzi]|eukprot:XP_811090.1 hypothetical protein [Trypanosoma cruzi strain CL Brener]
MNRRRSHRIGRVLYMAKDEDKCLRYLRPLGVGTHPCLRSQPSHGVPPFLSLSTSTDLLPFSPLATIPDTAVWTVGALHDDDVEGLMPPREVCLTLLSPGANNALCDVFCLALYFALNVYRRASVWSKWQLQQISSASISCDDRIRAVEFFQLLSQHSLTPPLDLFLSMTEYTLTHSVRLSKDGRQLQKDGPSLSVMPLVDATLSKATTEANLVLQRCDAEGIQTLRRASPLLYTRHCQRRRSEDPGVWVLKTNKHVKKGEQLTLQQLF